MRRDCEFAEFGFRENEEFLVVRVNQLNSTIRSADYASRLHSENDYFKKMILGKVRTAEACLITTSEVYFDNNGKVEKTLSRLK